MNESNIDSTIDQLNQLKIASPGKTEIVDHWIKVIDKQQKFLKNHAHPIIFIGNIGVGKSSLTGVAANLLIGEKPADKKSLKVNSVLSIGSGRTTICEVRIRSPKKDETGKLGLIIEPVSLDEMKNEIALYAETEWYRYHPDTLLAGDDDTEPTPQEIQRAIRNMTAYAEYQKIFFEGEKKKRRTVRPLDDVALRFDNHAALSEHLIECAQLTSRNKKEWWWNDCNLENMQDIKTLFDSINQGKEPTAMLPRCMDVVVPKYFFGSSSNLDMTLIDTRGLDGPVLSRDDLYTYMKDPRAIIILCTSFNDAPGDRLRSLLYMMEADAELRQAISRILLILIDKDDASQVNSADGEREFGQDLKIDECYRALETAGFSGKIGRRQIIAFDVLQDDRNRLQAVIDSCLLDLRKKVADQLDNWIRDAQTFLYSATNELRPELCNAIDKEIKEIMNQYPLPPEPPLRDPLAGLYAAIRESRYASVIYASCQRNGEYDNLNLYTAIRSKAAQEITQWLDTLTNMITAKLEDLQQKESLKLVQDHISLRKKQYQDAWIKVISDYANRVKEDVHRNLKNNPVWNKCVSEWGRGIGFKNKVLKHMEEWGNRQQMLTAHENTNARKNIPMLEESLLPPQSPQFRLYVRNLQVLRKIDWSPSQMSILIGANGMGKTTLLMVLKLLRVAYERGLPEAVKQVLLGSHNLRTRGINEDEPIEIGIELGTAVWRVQLISYEGTVSYQTKEFLKDQEREIFYRDSLGVFSYAGEQIEPNHKLGLRALMDRGVNEPTLRKVASLLQSFDVFYDADLWSLRHKGSDTSEDRILLSRGRNALTLLRRWHQERANNYRYQFVVEGLSAAFPNIIEDLDFVEAGNTLIARIFKPGQEHPIPLVSEANGVIQLLVLLCNLANAQNEGVIAIDEPENSLHPYALRTFLRRADRWARQHNLTVLLATHSTIILDELTASPERVYVMKTNESDETMPARLDKLCDREWLEGFKLGDLYEQGEIGSNEDEV